MTTQLPATLRAPFSAGGASAIDAQLANRLLGHALEAGGDYADIYFEFRVSADYALEDEQVKTLGRGITLGLGVRVTKGDATGYAYTEDLAWEKMAHAAKTAGQIAAGGGHAPVGVSHASRGQDAELLRGADAVADRSPRSTSSRCCAPPTRPRARSTRGSSRSRRRSPSRSRKCCCSPPTAGWRTTSSRCCGSACARSPRTNGKRQSGSGGGGGRYGMDYFAQAATDAAAHGREAARVAIAMLDAVDAPAGEMPVVLGPGDSGILLHEAVGHGLEADFNRKETSNYTGQIGKQVASPLCTVVDDGTIVSSRGAINVDDEGYAGQKNVLIENGILVGYMHDRLSAKHFGIEPTGNGRRESFRAMPLPRMTNTSLLGGKDNPDEIIKSVKRGIYAKRFSGGQVNISNGDFVFSLSESYLIEDGKLTAPLKGVNLIGNGPDVLRRVDMLGSDYQLSDGIWTCGKDGQSVPVNVGTPTVRIASITVGGTQA